MVTVELGWIIGLLALIAVLLIVVAFAVVCANLQREDYQTKNAKDLKELIFQQNMTNTYINQRDRNYGYIQDSLSNIGMNQRAYHAAVEEVAAKIKRSVVIEVKATVQPKTKTEPTGTFTPR